MSKHSYISFAVLLLASILFAAESPSATGWQLPDADARQWTERVRRIAPVGWTISNNGNDIIIQRDAAVRWQRVEVNLGAKEQGAEEPPPRLHEGVYRLTLRFGPQLAIQEYERLAAANAQTRKQREDLQRSVNDIGHKFDSYVPSNDDEKRRLATYRDALARLTLIPLPDLYTPDHSIQLLTSEDGWSILHDRGIAEECDGVRESILRYFGMYNAETAADTHNLLHPESTANEGSSKPSSGLPGADVE